ncbi:MAG: TIGR04076 family protein [Candidatus Thorarchaeota archaeon]
MASYKVRIEVIDIQNQGKCSMGQKIGDTYNYPEDRGKMCPSSFHILYPWIMVMESGGSFTESGDGHNYMTVGCSDYRHQVVYKITREPIEK